MTFSLDLLAALLLVGGACVVALSAIGVARLPDPFSRMHAAAKAGVVGSGLLLLGAGLALGATGALLTALAAILFLVLTAPIASHALGRAAYVAGAPLGAIQGEDALAGVITRHAFDTAPGPVQAPAARQHSMAVPAPRPVAIRRLVCCLLGGPSQGAATRMALELARDSEARVTGLSGAGLEPSRWQGPLPLGGAFWAQRLAARSRAQIRANCAAALEEFQALASAEPHIIAQLRHEEAEAGALAPLLAGQDLAVLPAGMGPHGPVDDAGMEIAAALAEARVVPLLRVRHLPGPVRSVLLLVGTSPGCGMLAAGLLRSGLWPSAAISILPVDEAAAAGPAMAQAELLHSHGRQAMLLPPASADTDMAALRPLLAGSEAAVMARLSTRQGGVFDSFRFCPFEATAGTVPLTLLP